MTPKKKKALDVNAIGPGSMLFEEAVSSDGHLTFHLPGRESRRVRLGNRLVGKSVAVVSQAGFLCVFDARASAGLLLAMAFPIQEGFDIFVFGEEGVLKMDQDGRAEPIENIVQMFRGNYLRCLTELKPELIGFRFLVNYQNTKLFSQELLNNVREPREINRVELWFEPRSGKFARAMLVVQERETQRLIREKTLRQFPIIWPTMHQRLADEKSAESLDATKTPKSPRVAPAPSPPAPPKPPRPRTTHLSPDDLVKRLREFQDDPAALWEEIEKNLELLEPHRTYRLVGAFPHEVAERSRDWPKYKLLEVFGGIPGPSLQLLFDEYPLDVCLSLADDHPDREHLFGYLKVHEIERLMSQPRKNGKVTADEARTMLRVGRQAGVKDIRRAWRLILSWLNADFGRQEERAVHQKKDDIAKRLQQARDLLIKR